MIIPATHRISPQLDLVSVKRCIKVFSAAAPAPPPAPAPPVGGVAAPVAADDICSSL